MRAADLVSSHMRAEHVDRLTDTVDRLSARIGAPILAAWNAKVQM